MLYPNIVYLYILPDEFQSSDTPFIIFCIKSFNPPHKTLPTTRPHPDLCVPHEVNDPVLEKRGIKIDAHDISISFKRNTTIKSKDVLKILPMKPLLDSIYF